MPRVPRAQQGIYTESIIERTKVLLGDTSVEYGMALCGALELVPSLRRYVRNFSATEAQVMLKVTDGQDEGADLIDEMQHQLEIIELLELIDGQLGSSPKPAPWFTPKPAP